MALKKVAAKDYRISWSEDGDSCHFLHSSGKGGDIGCGMDDIIEVFKDGDEVCVLCINYEEQYACIECFEDELGASKIVFFDPRDIKRQFGRLEEVKLKELAQIMRKA